MLLEKSEGNFVLVNEYILTFLIISVSSIWHFKTNIRIRSVRRITRLITYYLLYYSMQQNLSEELTGSAVS